MKYLTTITPPDFGPVKMSQTAERIAELEQFVSEASADLGRAFTANKNAAGDVALKGADFRTFSNEVRARDEQLKTARSTLSTLRTVASGNYAVGFGSDPGSGGSLAGAGGHKALGSFAAGLKSAGFDAQTKPKVTVSAYDALKSTFPAVTDFERRQGGIVPIGQDRRWLFPNLPWENAGTDLVVQDFKQTARTLSGNAVKRSPTATTEKARLGVTLTSVTEAIPQHAVVIEEIPNAILASLPQLSAVLRTEGEFEVFSSIDAHVRAQIIAATPPTSYDGTNLVERVRNAVRDHRALGMNPTILAVSGADAAMLDTLQQSDGGFMFGTSGVNNASPMWQLRVVEWTGDDDAPPMLIDVAALGQGYAGQMAFDANPYTGFSRNVTDLRIETSALWHVRNANGAIVIAED